MTASIIPFPQQKPEEDVSTEATLLTALKQGFEEVCVVGMDEYGNLTVVHNSKDHEGLLLGCLDFEVVS